MLNKIVMTLLLTLSLTVQADNKEGSIKYNASTGDTNLDLSLGKLDLKADGNINEFIKKLGVDYQVPTAKIEKLVFDYKFSGSEAYMAVSIGNVTNRSLDEIAKVYVQNRAKGWGYVAKQMGIKPGSKEFHQLKSGSDRILQANQAADSQTQRPSKDMKNRTEHTAKNKNKAGGNKNRN